MAGPTHIRTAGAFHAVHEHLTPTHKHPCVRTNTLTMKAQIKPPGNHRQKNWDWDQHQQHAHAWQNYYIFSDLKKKKIIQLVLCNTTWNQLALRHNNLSKAHSKINPKLVVLIYAHKQKQQAIATNTNPSFSCLISKPSFHFWSRQNLRANMWYIILNLFIKLCLISFVWIVGPRKTINRTLSKAAIIGHEINRIWVSWLSFSCWTFLGILS